MPIMESKTILLSFTPELSRLQLSVAFTFFSFGQLVFHGDIASGLFVTSIVIINLKFLSECF